MRGGNKLESLTYRNKIRGYHSCHFKGLGNDHPPHPVPDAVVGRRRNQVCPTQNL